MDSDWFLGRNAEMAQVARRTWEERVKGMGRPGEYLKGYNVGKAEVARELDQADREWLRLLASKFVPGVANGPGIPGPTNDYSIPGKALRDARGTVNKAGQATPFPPGASMRVRQRTAKEQEAERQWVRSLEKDEPMSQDRIGLPSVKLDYSHIRLTVDPLGYTLGALVLCWWLVKTGMEVVGWGG